MRKTSRNIFTCSFIFLLLLTLTGVAAAVPADSKSEASVSLFNDVSSSDVNVLYINYMAARGLISGFPDGSFHPADGLTRAQAAALLCRVKGLDTTSAAPSSFADVAGSHWAVSYINAAYQAGYISGFPDNTYQPEAMLTRAQGISLFLRTSSAPDTGEESVSLDDMDKSHWAAAAMATALAAGMITTDGNKINPEQAFNRGDAAKALSILLTQDPGLNQNQLTGKLKAKGKVSLKRAGSDEAQPVSAPAIVKAGDTIITGNDGEAEINFPDGSGILLKHNTQISITEAKGRAFIKSGGMPGTAVDNLEIELSQGKIFGALASKYTGNPEDNHTAANNKHKLLASRDQNFDLLAAKEGEQWYKTAEKKKVKVKVDMPWGVAAIRGSFWSNTVSGTGCGMTLLEGEGNLSSGGQTQNLSPGQSSGIGTQGTPPSPPGPMNPSEARDWSQQRGWVTDRASDMQNNRETPLGAPQGNQSGTSPMGNLTNILNQALNQAQITAGNQTGTGGGGSNNPGAQQVMAPTATPPAGSYITVPTVTLSTTTTGAAIYYTIDGSDPKTSNTRAVYSTPFNVAASATVKAYAVKTGMSDSQVVSFAYTINLLPLQAAAPTADPTPGSYDAAVSVSLNSATDGATIYYTTDNSDPKTSGTRLTYSTPININASATIKAYAVKPGISDSQVVSFDYTITISTTLPDGSKVHPRLACSPASENHLMVYEKHSGGNSMIYGQMVSADGSPIGNEVALSPAGANREPAAAFDAEFNKYLVLWCDRGDNPAIRGQVLEADGNLTGENFTVYAYGGNPQFSPNIVYDNYSGRFLAVWQDGDSSSDSDIMGRSIDFIDVEPVDGPPHMQDPIVISQAAGSQYDPAVAYNNGEYMVVFNDGNDLKGVLMNWDGVLGDIATIASANGMQCAAAICPVPVENNENYKFLVAWQDQRTGNFDIRARLVGNNETTLILGSESVITGSSNQETCPAVAAYNNYYLAAWQDRGLDNDIRARIFYPDCTPAGSVHQIAVSAGEQLHPIMINNFVNDNNNSTTALLAWEDQGSSPYNIGLNLFKESPPPKADWIIITNKATGNDEVKTKSLPMLIPPGTVVTVYNAGERLGSGTAEIAGSDGYFAPSIIIDEGFAAGLSSISVSMTLPGNNESELTTLDLPIPLMIEDTDYSAVTSEYGKILYKVTSAQKEAMETATGKNIDKIKAYTATTIETSFANLAAAEAACANDATVGVEVPTGDNGAPAVRDPGNYGWAIAAYDASNNVVAYYISDSWKIVEAGLRISPSSIAPSISLDQTFTLYAYESAGTFKNISDAALRDYVTLGGVFTDPSNNLTVGTVTRLDATSISVQVSGELTQTGYGKIYVAADAFEFTSIPGQPVRQVAPVTVVAQ